MQFSDLAFTLVIAGPFLVIALIPVMAADALYGFPLSRYINRHLGRR